MLTADLPVTPVYSVQLPPRKLIGIPGIPVAGGGEMVVFQFTWAEDKLP
jgi:hypothetical protein